ncbi:MAG TPA: polysaccharide deacetylase family protein [Sphingomicrobium sp.]|nr:polysaccharide deacetylase family protein [Sphingomicrobium sp.]
MLVRLLALCLLSISTSASASSGKVALTFDDLPALTILPDQPYVDYLNAMILYKLRRHHVPAIGFVNEGKIEELVSDHQVADLAAWLAAGMELGNHTYSHPSLNAVGAKAYIADIARGEVVTKALLRAHMQSMRYFRAPYLETGATPHIKQEVAAWLAAHGYRMAPVTIDADDWEFAEPYDDALARRDEVEQRRIRAEYLAYTKVRIGWAQASARALFGRAISHVMLLHCTRLNADTLDDVLRLLRKAHLKPVSLSSALKDPAYQRADTYVGTDGIDWLERWANGRNIDLPDSGNEDPPADIQAAYDRVDNDRR